MRTNRSRFRSLVLCLSWLPVAVVGSFAGCAERSTSLNACTNGLIDCEGVCVDTSTDPANCGACGEACPRGQACQAGVCGEGGAGGAGGEGGVGGVGGAGGAGGAGGEGGEGCGVDLTDCAGECIDTRSDPQHCGSCDIACAADQTCSGGVCAGGCGDGLTSCGGACVDTRTDPLHCGSCGRACSPSSTCVEGECTCNTDPSEPLGPEVPQTVTGTTSGAGDTRSLSCATASTPDMTYLFTAPTTGTFLFDTLGSSFNTALGVLAVGSCDQLACDTAARDQPQVSVDLGEGESVLVVVTGSGGVVGDFVLNVTQPGPVACAPTDIGSTVPQTQTGTTAGRGDSVPVSCNFDVSPDATYTFTAPADGIYLFSAASSSISPIVEVLDGSTCAGTSLGCGGGIGDPPRVVATLVADQTVLVAVEGSFGDVGPYTLSIDLAPPCPSIDLGSTVPQTVTGTNADLPDLLTPLCGFDTGGEATYSFTAPADGLYVFDTMGSTTDTILFLQDGACGGPEIGCSEAGTSSQQIVSLTAAQTVIVAVDSSSGGGDYVLNVSEFDTTGMCATPIVLDATVPQTVTGNSSGRPAEVEASCGGFDNGPDITYSFTAPMDGTYTIDTFGSSYDTVLHVHDTACSGPELECGDDSVMGSTSEVTLTLVAGQVIAIVVDAYSLFGGGPFVMNIH